MGFYNNLRSKDRAIKFYNIRISGFILAELANMNLILSKPCRKTVNIVTIAAVKLVVPGTSNDKVIAATAR
jgi:hypothetical protein